MLNSIHELAGPDGLHGAYALLVFLGSAAVVAGILLVALLLKAVGKTGFGATLKGGMLLLVGVLVGSLLVENPWAGNDRLQRRSLETQAAELTARALASGSALACLDGVASVEVEVACEKALFATPEAVAAAIAYVDARISLLAAGASLAERDPSFRPSFERARRAIEGDRFGLVAHVLVTRGCQSAGCTDLKLLRDTGRVRANMNARTFESHVAMHKAAWQASGAAETAAIAAQTGGVPVAAAPAPIAPPPPPVTTGAARGPVPNVFDFPSSASIPAVSIMNAEPAGPGGTPAEQSAQREQPEPRAKPAPTKRSQAQRRQVAPETVAPPMSVLPPPPPIAATR